MTVERDKRNYFRVNTALGDEIKTYLELQIDPTNVSMARVDNISVSGIGCVIRLQERLAPGNVVNHGLLVLSKNEQIPFSGVIKWREGNRVGIEFKSIAIKNQRSIFRYILRRERETIQVSE